MTILRVGQLVECLAEPRTERVLWIDRIGGGYYMIDVADPVAAPVFRKSEEMAQLYAGGLVRETLDDPWLAPISESSLSSAHKERRDKAWTTIRPLVDQQSAVFRPLHPSLRQFRYWFKKDNDVFQLECRRRTPRVYDKDMRALLSTSTSEVFGPGSRYQIDATIADVYLVSRLNPNRIVGRPVLYVVIDVFSRMIVGIYVGLEGPSWVGAMMAIANAASDKVAFCPQFKIDITEADWPCRHLPDALLGDRGEMLGSAVETLINNFHVRVENTAPYRTDWKGIVEQRSGCFPPRSSPIRRVSSTGIFGSAARPTIAWTDGSTSTTSPRSSFPACSSTTTTTVSAGTSATPR